MSVLSLGFFIILPFMFTDSVSASVQYLSISYFTVFDAAFILFVVSIICLL
jgi:hypothetical protein